jgi:hypothetical protein
MTRRLILYCAAARISLAGLVISPAGEKAEFSLKEESVVGLSGLAWCKGDLYYAVSDRAQALVPLRLTIDPATGMITAGKLEPPVAVKTAFSDFEDIVCDAAGERVFISAEGPPGIAGFTLAGKPLPPVKLPPVFLTARSNLSMEALTRDAATGHVWTANEDTLPGDGEVSSRKEGGLVRLQEFDAKWQPLRQFAWRTETSGLRVHGSGTGVSGLCLLPDGSLLVMERVLAGLIMEVRISLAVFEGATDTSRMPALAGVAFTPAQKVPIFKKITGFTNYEGIAAGPLLKDGSRSLVLVADSGEATTHTFMALKVAQGK